MNVISSVERTQLNMCTEGNEREKNMKKQKKG